MKNEEFKKHREQKKIVISYFFYNFGIFLVWTSLVAILSLQSSINIENGLGTITLAVTFVVEIICAVFFTPIAIRRYGAKIWLIIGDLGAIPYILANIYPSYYTLLPSGILLAVLQSSLWPSMCLVNVLYATLYSNVSKRAKDVHTIVFTGYFFAAFQLAQMCGGLLAYVVLYGFDQIPVPSLDSFQECQALNATTVNSTSCVSNHTSYQFCGIHDCQDPDVINETIQHYKPINSISLYVLIAISSLLAVCAAVVHAIFVPSDKIFEHKQNFYSAQMNIIARQREDGGDVSLLKNTDEDGEKPTALYAPSKGQSLSKQCAEIAKAIWRHVCHAKLLLIVPITFYNGLTMAFVATEMTRAFSSCIIGVQWVGIGMAIYGFFDAVFSWIVGKFGRKLGRIALYTIALVLDFGNYVYVILWSPSEFILLSVLIIYITFGSTDGIFQTIINVTHMDYFPQDEDLAVLVWNTVILFGFAAGYAISPFMCVGTRVYLNLGVLILGYVCLVAAEYFERKDKASKQTPADDGDDAPVVSERSSAIIS